MEKNKISKELALKLQESFKKWREGITEKINSNKIERNINFKETSNEKND
jgi:hypothetical protein